jgi:hypothetical protein
MRQHRTAVIAALALVLAAAGCDDSSTTGPTAPPPDDGETTAIATTPTTTTTTTPDTTGTDETTSTTAGSGGLPTVSTIIPQVPGELDPSDPNNQRFTTPDDPEQQAIIAAYIEASDRLAASYSTFPRNPDDPLLVDGPYTAEWIQRNQKSAIAVNESTPRILDVSGGVTYRPYITGYVEGDDEAVVFDCQLDASVWRDPATGEKIDPSPVAGYPNTGPEIASPAPVGAKMIKADGRWLMDDAVSQPGACL